MSDNLKVLTILFIFSVTVFLPIATITIITTQRYLSSVGIIKSGAIEIYELDGVTPQTELDWGTIGNGSYYRYGILENTGNVALTLSMTSDEALEWLTFDWNCTNYVIEPDERVGITWNLTISNAPDGATFSFSIYVRGTET